MKKAPIHAYNKKSGRWGITAQMASESKLRTQQWLKNGCNGFDMKAPISNPMSFWFEQDVLVFMHDYWDDLREWVIREVEKNTGNKLSDEEKVQISPLAKPYGDIVTDGGKNGCDGQMMIDFSDCCGCEGCGDGCECGVFDDLRPTYKTTGINRTGCVFCGYFVHHEKYPNRFDNLYKDEPKIYDYVMRGGHFDEKDGLWKPYKGLGYWYCIEWINEHGNLHITYPNREYYLKKYMTDECKALIYKKNEEN